MKSSLSQSALSDCESALADEGIVRDVPPRANASWLLRTTGRPDSSAQDSSISTVPFRVGRSSDNDLCIADPTVSGQHAELFFAGENLLIRDRNSTNGTFVNGHRVQDVEQLRDGDQLQFGVVKMSVVKRVETSSMATVSADVIGQAMAHFQFEKLLAQPAAVVPHFQPIVQIADARFVGFEILGRSPLAGLETPADMFRVAAERSQESTLSRVLRSEGMRIGRSLGTERTLYVNTHPEELGDPLLFESLEELRIENPESAVILEVHEAAVTSSVYLSELRKRLCDLNIGLAYDDFGAGQARLVELSDVPPDVIKFDLKLVQGLAQASAERRRMVGALVNIVCELGVIPLAEGVETKDEADVCRELGFVLAQGFYFGRPAPVDRWLSDPGK